jgi:hypothetical protein
MPETTYRQMRQVAVAAAKVHAFFSSCHKSITMNSGPLIIF